MTAKMLTCRYGHKDVVNLKVINEAMVSMQVMPPFLFFQTDDRLKWVRKNGHWQLSFSVCESLSSEFMALECVRGRHGQIQSRSWEFQKRLTCHLCVVVSKIRVWKRRDFKQSAIIEGAYLNVFFMSTLVGFSARWRSVIGSILHSAQCLIPTLCEMIYLIKRFSTQMDRKYAD